MCGIIGIVSRPSSRPVPDVCRAAGAARPGGRVADSQTEIAALVSAVRSAAARRARSAGAWWATASWSPAISARLDRLDARVADRRAAHRSRRGRCHPTRSSRPAPKSIARPRRAVGGAQRSPPHRSRRSRRSPGATPVRRPSPATSRCSRRCRRSIGSRSAAATRPACTCSSGTTACRPTILRSPRCWPSAPGDPLFQSGSVRVAGQCLSFVYKAAAEIGELGDNTRALRAAIEGDALLRLALATSDGAAARCSATLAGPASASSASPTAIR